MRFSLSVQPASRYAWELHDPLLGYFEDSTSFPSLTIQLRARFIFSTFYNFFSKFRHFYPVIDFLSPDGYVDDDGELGIDEIAEPLLLFGRLGCSTVLPWIFLFEPTYSVLYLLFCLRKTTAWGHLLSLVKLFQNLVLSAGFMICPIFTWIYSSVFVR